MKNNDIHVYPINDTHEHVTDCLECSCSPSIEVVGASLLIIHNSFDNREMSEQVVSFLNGHEIGVK